MENTKFIKVVCPACGQQVEAVVRDDRIKGYCTTARQYVNYLVETKMEKKDYRQDPEYRTKLRAATKKMWQDPEYRDKQRAALKKKGMKTKF
ncbi:MAG: hypothetical protein JSV74_00935 [Dehalococcoidia bacterium]|nr:MAG: hypothetical protein JSV74_00935 [Dehalococcoidia bacterium]